MKKLFKVFTVLFLLISCVSFSSVKAQGSGAISNPYDILSMTNITFQEYEWLPKYEVGIQLLETYDGNEAAEFVNNGNMFNEKAASDEQWIVMRIKLKHNGGTDQSLNANSIFNSYKSNLFYKSNGVPITPRDTAVLSGLFPTANDIELSPGTEGIFYFGILIKKQDGYPYIKVSSNADYYNKSYTWLKTSAKKITNGISMKYSEKTIECFKSIQLSATVTPTDYPNKVVYWSVGNSDIAIVSDTGEVTGRNVGNTYVYAKTANGKTARTLIKVRDATKSIIFETDTKEIEIGKSSKINFSIQPNYVEQIAQWRVGNSSIATVSSTGIVSAKGVGNTYVYARTWDGKEAKCLIKVKGQPTTSIKLDSSKAIGVGQSSKLNLSVSPSLENAGVMWRIGNSSIASINSNGTVTGKSVGNTYAYAKTWDGKEVKCLIRVLPKTNSITLNNSTKMVALGTTTQFSATNSPSSSSVGNTWRTGNSTIATVNSHGVLTAKSVGNTYVYVKSWDGKEAKCLVKVLPASTSINLNVTTKNMKVGSSAQLKSTIAPTGASSYQTWRIGNSAIASVDANGKVTAKAVGNTYVYVKTWDGKEAKCLIKVSK